MNLRHRIGGTILALAGCLLALGPAEAAPPTRGLIYLDDGLSEVSPLSFGRITGWTEFTMRADYERADEFDIRETIVSPLLHLATNGSVYHASFLSFYLDGSASLESRHATGGENTSDLVTFNDYNSSFQFFKERKTNFSLFARRSNAWVDSPFRSSYRIRDVYYGADFNTRLVSLPLSVSYNRTKRKEDYSADDRIEKHNQFRASLIQRATVTQSDFTFRFLDFEQNLQPQSYETINTAFNNSLQVIPGTANVLRSHARYFNQYGTIGRRDFSLSEDLYLHWPKEIQQILRYQFNNQTGPASGGGTSARQLIEAHRGSLRLQHTLYGSLTSAIETYMSQENVFDTPGEDKRKVGFDRRRGVRADFSYKRRTPIGRLSVGIGYERIREDQGADERSRFVGDEPHVLTDGNEPQLNNTRVDAASVVVTDDTGFIVYQENIDYTIVTFGIFTRIFRVASGSIADGQPILVDYRFMFSPDLSFNTTGQKYRVGLDTNRDVSIYYRYSRYRDDFISGTPNGFLEDQRRHVVGVRMRARALSMGNEYELNRLIESEFSTNRLFANYDGRISRGTRVHLGGTYTWSRFTEADQTLNTFLVNGRLITNYLGFGIESGLWFRVDRGRPDEAGLDSELIGSRLDVSRSWEALTLTAGVIYRNTNDNNRVRDERTNLLFSLRRTF